VAIEGPFGYNPRLLEGEFAPRDLTSQSDVRPVSDSPDHPDRRVHIDDRRHSASAVRGRRPWPRHGWWRRRFDDWAGCSERVDAHDRHLGCHLHLDINRTRARCEGVANCGTFDTGHERAADDAARRAWGSGITVADTGSGESFIDSGSRGTRGAGTNRWTTGADDTARSADRRYAVADFRAR
jgi:hypothetical protein